ncbi:MAG: beta-glucosidase [Roseibacillus sp.]|nr:beta-glucosidase [Roseibacillus sp.]
MQDPGQVGQCAPGSAHLRPPGSARGPIPKLAVASLPMFALIGTSMRAPSRLLLLALLVLFTAPPVTARDEIEDTISLLLARMTLEEKVGQMTQLTLGAVSRSKADSTNPDGHRLDLEKLRQAVVEKHVGSILNVHAMAFSARHWHSTLNQIQDLATTETRHKIPILYGIDSVHGANYVREATLFPHNINLAATWNPELVEKVHAVTARETRAAGIPWNFGPCLDVGRQPLWSRFAETFGEDVHVSERMATAAVRGLQGNSLSAPYQVAATAKHFLAYSNPHSGRDRTQSLLPERYLREHFLPPFIRAVEEDVQAIMVNSSEVNGLPVHANHNVLTKLLRGRMKFEGVVITDWEDVRKLHELHRVAPSVREAVRLAVEAGIDMCMVPNDFHFTDNLIALVREGLIPEEMLDNPVRRILRLKHRLGLFEQPMPDPSLIDEIGREDANALSLQAARESLVLLKNNGILPLSQKGKILLTGPGCHSLAALHGSWSYTWQGADEKAYPPSLDTILEAFNAGHGRDNVLWARGAQWDGSTDFDYAIRKAQNADAIVCVLAEEPSTETPGNISDLAMPQNQLRLVRSLATGKPLILVLLESRPRLITEVAGLCHAIIYAGQPGPHGGAALYELLTGRLNPSGRLPFTYPRSPHNLLPYDHKYSDTIGRDAEAPGFHPLYAFGHGLSFTSFEYDNLKVPAAPLAQTDRLAISVEVTNTGQRRGIETIHLYVRDLYASVTPPVKRLRAFTRAELGPGERRTIKIELPISDLAFFGPENYPIVEPGEFEVMIGNQTAKIAVE